MTSHGILRGRRWLAILSCLVCALFVAGFAACVVCDLSNCCDQSDHEDDAECACACAIHGDTIAGRLDPPCPVNPGETITEGRVEMSSAVPPLLFRPPRPLA